MTLRGTNLGTPSTRRYLELMARADAAIGDMSDCYELAFSVPLHRATDEDCERLTAVCEALEAGARAARAMEAGEPRIHPRDPENLDPYGAGTGPIEHWSAA